MTWRNLYNSCLCELDPTRLTELIYDTEHAMLSRCRELPADDDAERFEINDALEVLLILKQKRLDWPHPYSDSSRNGHELG
jgi:hypothetical protein